MANPLAMGKVDRQSLIDIGNSMGNR